MKTILTVIAVIVAAATLARASEPKGGWVTVPPADVEKIKTAVPGKPIVAPAKPHTFLGSTRLWRIFHFGAANEPRKLLVFWLCEGFPHASIPWCNKMLEIMAEKTGAFTVTLSKDKTDLNTENLKQYDGILLNNTTALKLSPEQEQALLDFVNNGKGLIGIHAATDNFNDWPEGVALIGGQFDQHPWTSGGTWAFKLDDPTHPLNKSFEGKGFALKDEIYQIKGPYSHDTHRELISLDMRDERNHKVDQTKIHRTDGDFPVAWLKRTGKGRVFYCSLGHNKETYFNPAVLAHYLAGIQYALGDYKVDDTPTAKK